MEPRVGPGGDNVDQVIIKLGATSKERALNKLLDNTGSGTSGVTGVSPPNGSNNGYKGPTTFNQYTSNGVTNQYSSNVNQLSLGVIAYDDSTSGLAQPTTGIGLYGAGVSEGVYDPEADIVWYEVTGSSGMSSLSAPITDNFDRADQTGLGTTSDGQLEWYMIPSDYYYSAYTFVPFNIVSNQAWKSSAVGTTSMNSAMLNIRAQNIDASVDFRRVGTINTTEFLMMTRCSTNGIAQFSSGVHIATVSNIVYVFEWDGNVRYTTASVNHTVGMDGTMRVKLEGTSCDVWIDGVLVISTTLTKRADGGAFGFGWAQYSTNSVGFENLTIS